MPATVSVIIPAFNAAAFLGEALDSVFAQSYQPKEIIVVDDGSDDETPQVMSAFAGRITYVHKQKGGPSSARNAGIRTATGEWIAFLDADDIWMPDLLEKLFKAAAESAADFAFGDVLILKNGSIVGPTFFERHNLKGRHDIVAPNQTLINPFSHLLEFDQFILPSAVLVRRDALFAVELFDEDIYCAEDLDLWLRLALKYRFAIVNQVLVHRRIHARNLSRDPWVWRAGLITVYEKLDRYALTLASSTRWRKVLQKRKGALLREHGACYLEIGELLLARKSWAKSFRATWSPRLAVYWLATLLPQSWIETLCNRKRKFTSAGVCSGPPAGRLTDAD